MKWRCVQNTVYWFDLRVPPDKGLGFHQSKNNAISLRHTVQAEVLVKVVTSNKDDSQGEILSQKKKDQIREEVRHIRSKEGPYAARRAVGNHQGLDRPILEITSRID